jgi:hypothetical protein
MNPELILGIVEEGLVLINKLVPDQAMRIQKEINEIRELWIHEYSKVSQRNDSMLDHLELRLAGLRSLFALACHAADSKIKQ